MNMAFLEVCLAPRINTLKVRWGSYSAYSLFLSIYSFYSCSTFYNYNYLFPNVGIIIFWIALNANSFESKLRFSTENFKDPKHFSNEFLFCFKTLIILPLNYKNGLT